jgi:hypothetical protein
MATALEFRFELQSWFHAAERAGLSSIDVVARNLHDTVQRTSPTRTQRLPNCCSAMRQEQRVGIDVVISEKANDGTNFAIRYRLTRPR